MQCAALETDLTEGKLPTLAKILSSHKDIFRTPFSPGNPARLSSLKIKLTPEIKSRKVHLGELLERSKRIPGKIRKRPRPSRSYIFQF